MADDALLHMHLTRHACQGPCSVLGHDAIVACSTKEENVLLCIPVVTKEPHLGFWIT